jgi:hypothetical protein
VPKSDKTRPGKNGGTLNVGNPGNKGSTGRPTNEMRNRLKEAHWKCLDLIDEELKRLTDQQNKGEPVLDAILDVANHVGKYGLGTKTEAEVTEISAEEALKKARQFLREDDDQED